MTKVIFYLEPEEVSLSDCLLAVFPDKPYKPGFDATVVCYSKIGQHSGLCIEYLRDCKLATEDRMKMNGCSTASWQ